MTERLPALEGNQWVPVWTVRPGAFRAVRHLPDAMPLWQVIYSRTGNSFRPCIQSVEQLGATIGISRSTASRKLNALRDSYLVFELPRGRDPKTRSHRPPARWALDPFAEDHWRTRLEKEIKKLAQHDRQGSTWESYARTALDEFCRASARLREDLSADVRTDPSRKGQSDA